MTHCNLYRYVAILIDRFLQFCTQHDHTLCTIVGHNRFSKNIKIQTYVITLYIHMSMTE